MPEVFNTSRGAYETLLRHRMLQIPNVKFVSGAVIEIIKSETDQHLIEEVKYRTNDIGMVF